MALSLKAKIREYVGRYDVPGTIYWFNNDPAVNIFIPDEPDFSWIKYYCLKGNGLYESYKAAGAVQAGVTGYPLEQLYPNPILAMPIKFFIYDVTDLVNGQPVSRPYGDGVWIHEQASKILAMYFLGPLSYPNYDPRTATWGRLELEQGTVLPTEAEGVCIKKAINYEGMNITQAFAKCNCSEILPTKYLAQIENLIKTTNDTMFYIYMIAITLATKPPPGGCPEGTKLNPITMVCDAVLDKKNYNLYIGLAIAAIFLLKGD
jgi:hypothetical protein